MVMFGKATEHDPRGQSHLPFLSAGSYGKKPSPKKVLSGCGQVPLLTSPYIGSVRRFRVVPLSLARSFVRQFFVRCHRLPSGKTFRSLQLQGVDLCPKPTVVNSMP